MLTMKYCFINHYGIQGIINNRFRSNLSGRCQTTQAGGKISKKEKVVCSVPQGSILGQLLFLLYINDIQTKKIENIPKYRKQRTGQC